MPPLVLATRPQPAADALVARLEGLGYRALAAPMLHIERMGRLEPQDLAGIAALAFTSAAAARAVVQDLGVEAIANLTIPAYCVGAATAKAARAAGFATVVSADGDGAALEAAIAATCPLGPVLHLRGEDLAHDLAAGLRARGFSADERLLYRAAPAKKLPAPAAAALVESEVDAALFLSARTAEAFLRLASPESAGRAIFISERAASVWPKPQSGQEPSANMASARRGLHTVAPMPTLQSVLEALHHVKPISGSETR